MRFIVSFLTVSCFLLCACENTDSASETVILFANALEDSLYSEAWEMLSPESQLLYDSTVAVLHEFGWTEAQTAVYSLIGELTEDEFVELTGKALFTGMIASSPEVHSLSTNIESVTYPTDSLAVIVLNTADGLQEILLQNVSGCWYIDLTELLPAQ